MNSGTPARAFWRKARVPLLGLGVVLAVYLALVWAGGGWGPRHDAQLAWDNDSILLFAHRGVAAQAPENSDAAFEAARRLGFPGIELDIRKTSDGHLALCHDPAVQRMLGLNRDFSDMSLAELKERGLLLDGRETTNHIPSLREIFAKYGATFRFYLDMKERHFRDADQLARLIQEFGLENRTIVASVDPLFVVYLEHYYPRINTALERFDTAQVWLYRLLPRRWKPDFLSGLARKADSGHVEWLKRNHLVSQRIVYEVTEANYQQMLQLGITKAVVDYAPGVYSAALSPPGVEAASPRP